jgi:hypothetical protein
MIKVHEYRCLSKLVLEVPKSLLQLHYKLQRLENLAHFIAFLHSGQGSHYP